MITLHADHFPLVLLDMSLSPRSAADLRGMFDAFKQVAARARRENVRYGLICMTQDLIPASERRDLAESANHTRNDFGLIGVVVAVLPNRLFRGILTALFWLIPGLPPIVAASNCEEAVKNAASNLRAQGLNVGDDTVRAATAWLLSRRSAGAPARSFGPGGRE